MGLSNKDRIFLQTLLEEEVVTPTELSKACMNAASLFDAAEGMLGAINDGRLVSMALRYNWDFAYVPGCGVSDVALARFGVDFIKRVAREHGAIPLHCSDDGLWVGVFRSWPFDEREIMSACRSENAVWLALKAEEYVKILKKF